MNIQIETQMIGHTRIRNCLYWWWLFLRMTRTKNHSWINFWIFFFVVVCCLQVHSIDWNCKWQPATFSLMMIMMMMMISVCCCCCCCCCMVVTNRLMIGCVCIFISIDGQNTRMNEYMYVVYVVVYYYDQI